MRVKTQTSYKRPTNDTTVAEVCESTAVRSVYMQNDERPVRLFPRNCFCGAIQETAALF